LPEEGDLLQVDDEILDGAIVVAFAAGQKSFDGDGLTFPRHGLEIRPARGAGEQASHREGVIGGPHCSEILHCLDLEGRVVGVDVAGESANVHGRVVAKVEVLGRSERH